MPYNNTVKVNKEVYKALKDFCRDKAPSADIFDELDPGKLNTYLKTLMEGLSAKVFRTYNASSTLDTLLFSEELREATTVAQKMVFYNRQNKEVAILCNHQKTVTGGFEAQMAKMNAKVEQAKNWITELERGISELEANPDMSTAEVTEFLPEKPVLDEGMTPREAQLERQRAAEAPLVANERSMTKTQMENAITRTELKIEKLELDIDSKEDLKTVALGTSKVRNQSSLGGVCEDVGTDLCIGCIG